MNRSTFIVGAAALFTAVFVAISITFRSDSPEGLSATESRTGASAALPNPSSEDETKPDQLGLLKNLQQQAASTPSPPAPDRSSSPLPAPAATPFSVSVSPALLAEATPAQRLELVKVAREIKEQASAELQMLTDQFDLTEPQRAKIFPLLVQGTPAFGPGIDIGGIGGVDSTTGVPEDRILESPDAVEDAIFNELDPDQQDEMIEVAIDNQSWWSEIVGQLEDDLDASIGEPVAVAIVVGDDPTTVDEQPARNATVPVQYDESGQPIISEPEAHQGGNIFDLIND